MLLVTGIFPIIFPIMSDYTRLFFLWLFPIMSGCHLDSQPEACHMLRCRTSWPTSSVTRPPLQRSTLLPNRRRVGRTSPTVLKIHCAVMDPSWSRMCCGDVEVATKIGDRRYDFSVVLCSNDQQLLKHNDNEIVWQFKMICFDRTGRCDDIVFFWLINSIWCLSWGLWAWKIH